SRGTSWSKYKARVLVRGDGVGYFHCLKCRAERTDCSAAFGILSPATHTRYTYSLPPFARLKASDVAKVIELHIHFSHLCDGKLGKLPLQPQKCLRDSQDFVSKIDFPSSLGPSKVMSFDIDSLALESKGPSLKRKFDLGDLVTPRKRRLLKSYSTATYVKLLRYIPMLRSKAEAQLDPFALQRVTSHKPCKTKTFIWSLPVEILIATTVALLGVQDLRTVTQVSSLLREIAAPLFFLNRNFPTSPKDLFHIRVDPQNFDVLATWRRTDTFRPPRMVLSWLDSGLRSSQLSAFSHFLESVPHKSIRYITLLWNFDILTSPVLPQIVALLESIRASGVEELTCMGFCDGTVSSSVTGLNPNSAVCSLEKLRLSSVKLSSAHWDKLLRHLAIPTLVELRVNADLSSRDLVVLGGPIESPTRLSLSLSMLDGPLSHLLPVLRSHLSGAAGDTLALSAAWIQALPKVKRFTLRGYSATTAEDLVNIMRSFAAGDVELGVDVQVAPKS
ncbi:hypothetical protein DFJ58DRAFT_846564, partial [Suillus subalutaceus]|uniref:uncharacterized protein n=1 Tax=Suillus subalutaceus TaxID=48586 RepID=UPI001B870E28